MTNKEIRKLSPLQALELGDRARRGDSQAVRDFVSYAAWRKINSEKKSHWKKIFQHELMMRVPIEVNLHG